MKKLIAGKFESVKGSGQGGYAPANEPIWATVIGASIGAAVGHGFSGTQGATIGAAFGAVLGASATQGEPGDARIDADLALQALLASMLPAAGNGAAAVMTSNLALAVHGRQGMTKGNPHWKRSALREPVSGHFLGHRQGRRHG